MVPLHVSHSDLAGGAARAAYRLHCALRSQNVDSTMLVAMKLGDDFSVLGPRWNVCKALALGASLAGEWTSGLQKTRNPSLHSVNLIPSPLFQRIIASKAEVINLHWINGEAISIAQIGRIDKPLVFTLHDMWAFCGAEHYTHDCPEARFRVGYTSDNRIQGHKGLDMDQWTWLRKRRHWKIPRHVVCPSRWLANCVKESALMHDWPVHVIPNALNTERFRPLDKAHCRQVLGLPLDVPLISFGAVGGAKDSRKGFDLLLAALDRFSCLQNTFGAQCVVFGQSAPQKPESVGLPLRFMGHLRDEWSLVLLYNAIDVMVVPSRQDNLPQTATEAQACGTPVVAFDTCGLPDAVEHKTTGYLAEKHSAEDLCYGIQWVLEDADRHMSLGVAARARAKHLWSTENVVPQYLEVYRAAIADHSRQNALER